MIVLTLPDGSRREYDQPLKGAAVAASIGAGLAKAALAIKIDGAVRDLDTMIDRDARIEIVTRTHPDALDLLRHDAAHVMAEAVQELYPGTQITFGPATETGFYYDFYREQPFTPDDFAAIEDRMRAIVDRDEVITREVWSRDEAVKFFRAKGESFKAEHIGNIPADEEISLYRQGNFIDLCTGPHLPSTGKLGKAFKLMKVAGAYWRGDPDNPQLQRIYGTCWADKEQLNAHLTMLEEAEKRDHRRLGREMDLFHLQEEAAGSVFWHAKGWVLYRAVENYIRRRLDAADYIEVKTPQLYHNSLWHASGHWEKFRDGMYVIPDGDGDDQSLVIKPMNCPAHVQIFKQGIVSYRDLPIRMAEFGSCHRNEPSGALHGIMRVRAFTQDDAHIFCTPQQVTAESVKFCRLLQSMYSDFGFDQFFIKFADRPPLRAGSDETWDRAEAALKQAVAEAGLDYVPNPGEGAFYGPKLEFVLRDAIGRDWQCGTLQMDFVLPERLDAHYIGEDGQKHRPVMLHRAAVGSLERFIGVLIEHYAGKFPLWLAPVQAVVATITSDADEYGRAVTQALREAGLRVETDFRNEKINYKIREHSLKKVPIMLVVGRKEAESMQVALRRLGGDAQQMLALDAAVAKLRQEAQPPA